MPRELVAQAIGLIEGMPSSEIDRRIKDLVGRLGVFERKDEIQPHIEAIREKRRANR